MTPLPRTFYERPTLTVARELLGHTLIRRTADGVTAGAIVETEAYIGPVDRASHAAGGKRTPRTEIQFGPGGFAYVYRIYGLYCCFCVVTEGAGRPEVVLIRALRPLQGVEIMESRRGVRGAGVTNGPSKLCIAMGIDMSQYGVDLCASESLWVTRGDAGMPPVASSPRINIDYAGEHRDLPWRFYATGDSFVSRSR